MEPKPDLESVYQALFVLYHEPGHANKERVNKWLSELQKSLHAWEISNELLRVKRDLESCYFAAQTMRSKIQECFHELPAEMHETLRDCLIQHISNINEQTDKVIVVQLCVALADLALQMVSWQDPVHDLINKFGHSRDGLWPLLEILTVIPEELSSWHLGLVYNRRQDIRKYFFKVGPTVSDFLEMCLKTHTGKDIIYSRILRCFGSWVSEQAVPFDQLRSSNVVAVAFQVLHSHEVEFTLHTNATDCVCAILQNVDYDMDEFMFGKVVALSNACKHCFELNDLVKLKNYCRIMTDLADTNVTTMINCSRSDKPHYTLEALDLVLMCCDYYDYEVIEMTLELWFSLSELLYDKSNEKKNIVFRPYINKLLHILWKHCKMPADSLTTREEADELFADFRYRVSHLIKDVIYIAGVNNYYQQMFANFGAADWPSIEATLYVMQAVGRNVSPKESEVVPKVVEAILNLGIETPLVVRHTSILLLGELCEWINYNCHVLEAVSNFLFGCLHEKGLANAALVALKDICIACSKLMTPHLPFLIQLSNSLDSLHITNNSANSFLAGISKLASKLPHKEMQQAVRELLWIQAKPLSAIVESPHSMSRGTKTDPIVWLDRIATIFRNLRLDPKLNLNPHPCQQILGELWSVLSMTLDKYQQDGKIVERACRCFKFAIRCLGKGSSLIVQQLAEQMVRLYALHPHSSYLYLSSILVDEFADDAHNVPFLLEILKALLGPTFSLLERPNGLVNHPDSVDDLFRLCDRFLQKCPVALLQQDVMDGILKCALFSCSFDHKDANTSVVKFFYDLVYCCKCSKNQADLLVRQQLVQQVIGNVGERMVSELVHASVFTMSTYVLPDITDVLLLLAAFNRDEFSKWLWQAVTQLPTKSGKNVSKEQLHEFHKAVVGVNADSNEVNTALRNFKRLFR